MRRSAALAALLLLLLLPAGPARGADPVPEPALEPAPELLLEPPAPNETQRLLAESRRTTSWCDLLSALDDLRAPDPDDLDELVVFGQAYHQNTTFLDRRSTVRDTTSKDDEARVRVPASLVAGVEEERTAMYALDARMVQTRLLLRRHEITRDQVARRVRLGFARLMASGFTEADAALQAERPERCR